MNAGAANFRAFIAERGFKPPERIEPGRWCPFSTNGKDHDTAGRAKLFPDGEGGIVHDWRTGESWTWQAARERAYTPAEIESWREKCERAKRDAEAERGRERKQTAERARAIWSKSQPAPEDHPYLVAKGVKSHGLRQYRGPLALNGMRCDGALLIPARTVAGEIASLQFIAPDGTKRHLNGEKYPACYYGIGKPDGVLLVAEGYATAASLNDATGHAVAVAFDAGNLEAVARVLRAKLADAKLILCADNDLHSGSKPNTGRDAANRAAQAVGGLVAVPELDGRKCDFNDLAKECGAEAVQRAVRDAVPPLLPELQASVANAPASEEAAHEWPEPQPFTATIEPEPYPVDALPATIRAAVEEVQAFTKAPTSLVAASALGALSVAAQALQDVKRAEKLQGPSSLFLLTIAESGERKTTCDAFFTAAIREYEHEQAEAAKPELARYAAEIATWEAEREGILAAIKQAGKTDKPTNGKPIDTLRAELVSLENAKPQAPRVPNLIRGDDTPENLAWVLAHRWPSAGVLSSEAGAILGAHGMGRDSIMRNLALLNLLWDGGALKIGRKTSESFTVRGARLTVALQVQEATLRSFFDKSDGLARGTGFLSRFLVAWPESTQGERPFSEAPQAWPALATFNRRIRALLDTPTSLDADGALSPSIIALAPDAKAAWIAFHDAIEAELRSGGELHDVRDVAAKAADNAARLAALFQVLERGAGGAVGLEAFEGASRIAAWHLNEARRFFGELALPVELANAARLDSWLIEHCRRNRTHIVSRREIQRNVTPGRLREKAALSDALRELTDAGRIREVSEGRRKEILVNPALLLQGAA